VGPAIASEKTRQTATTTKYQLHIPRSAGPKNLEIRIMTEKLRPATKSFAINVKPADLSITSKLPQYKALRFIDVINSGITANAKKREFLAFGWQDKMTVLIGNFYKQHYIIP
jgi:hypothetical protein